MKIMITEEKKEKLSEHAEKILRHAGKLMSCIETLEDEDDEDYGERNYRMGMREDDEDMPMHYGERRGRGRSGRYSRY